MSPNRRDFLTTSALAGAALTLGSSPGSASTHPAMAAPAGRRSQEAAPRSLRLLILGGTGVTGPHTVARALDRGHEVTTFTRGQTRPSTHADRFRDVEQLVGDRAGNLDALRGRTWDAVIDNSGRDVAWTEASAELLKDAADLYLYTSSTGAYFPYVNGENFEDQEVLREVPEDATEDERFVYDYGVMKANSEAAARRIFGEDRTIVSRPTYMMGPGDSTDRFTYWPVRLARGGEVLVPGRGRDPVQFIDVRDVARFVVHLLETRQTGTFNVAGPASRMGMHPFVFGAHATFNSPVEWVMVPDYDFLEEHNVPFAVPWIMPRGNNEFSAVANVDRAVAAGLTYTPLADSVRDLHEWWWSDAVPQERRDQMLTGERSLIAREPEIIAAWRAREG
jgi:2'-hydroxyisoflavone reductase